MKTPRHTQGMTLLEVMVAIALLAVLGAMASKGLAQVIRARDVVFGEQARWRSVAMAWARIGEDVTTTADGMPLVYAELRWQGDASTARWATWGATGSVLPIQYALKNGTLVRTQGADLARPRDALPGTSSADRGATPALEAPLLEGVRSMTLAYLDAQGQWHARWPIEGAPYARPHALRMALVLEDGRDVTRIFALP